MKQNTVSKWIPLKPFIVVMAVYYSQRHGYMAVQNGEHKWERKKY